MAHEETGVHSYSREYLTDLAERFYAACNLGDEAALAECLAPGCTHYFPPGYRHPTFHGPGDFAAAWSNAIQTWGSHWTIDRVLVDEALQEIVVEWTHFRRRTGGRVRGLEVCRVDDSGKIAEVRAYYAVNPPDPDERYELVGFDYAGRGYPTEPPASN